MSKLKCLNCTIIVSADFVVASQLLNVISMISNNAEHSGIDNSSSYNDALGTLSYGLLTVGTAISVSGLATALYRASSGWYDSPEAQAEALEMMGLVPIEDTYVRAA